MWDGEIDPVFRKAVKLLHSTSSDSAEKIRKYLDEMIKKRHGSSKMLANTLSEKWLTRETSAHMNRNTKTSSRNIAEHITVTRKRNTVVNPVIKSVPDDDDLKVESDLNMEQNNFIMDEEYLEDFVTDADIQSISDDDDLILDETNSIVEETDLIMIQDLED